MSTEAATQVAGLVPMVAAVGVLKHTAGAGTRTSKGKKKRKRGRGKRPRFSMGKSR